VKRLLLVLVVLAGAGLLVAWKVEVWPFGPVWLRVVDEDGLPLWRALVLVRRAGSKQADFTETADGAGWVRIPREVVHSDSELLATAPACGVARGAMPSGREVVLPEGVAVTLTVPGEFPLPRPPWKLWLQLAPDADEGHWSMMLAEAVAPPDYWDRSEMERDRDLWIDPETRSVQLVVPRAGRWRVHWSLMHFTVERREGVVSRSGSGSGPAGPVVLEIPGGDAPVELPIDPDELKEYMAR